MKVTEGTRQGVFDADRLKLSRKVLVNSDDTKSLNAQYTLSLCNHGGARQKKSPKVNTRLSTHPCEMFWALKYQELVLNM